MRYESDGPPSPIVLAANVVALDEERFVFDAMVARWGDQQTSRGLQSTTIERRQQFIRRFQLFCQDYPWRWAPGDVEDFTTRARSGAAPLTRATLRSYQLTIRLFCDFICDIRYGWPAECANRFGVAPQQICHDWNTIAHLLDFEARPGRRALTTEELQRFFDAADDRVDTIVRARRKGALNALRDSQIFKTIYGFGLRRAEVVGLDIADLRSNPAAPRFGRFGALYVRHGKATRGTGPKRRTVLTVPEIGWIVDGLTQWIDLARPRFVSDWNTDVLWPTERRTRVSTRYLNMRFADLRDQVGLPTELTPHALRHTYVTNLIEWGYSEKFVQDQVGHAYASTTAIYTSVGDDFKNRALARALSQIYGDNDGN